MERLKRLSKRDALRWATAGSIAAGSLMLGLSLVETSEAEDGQVAAQGYSILYRDAESYVVLPNITFEGKSADPPIPTPTPTFEPTPTPEPLYIHPEPDGRILNPIESDSAASYDKEIWRKLFSQYDWNVDHALSVMFCESRGNPWVTGDAGEWGLMQMHPRWQGHRFEKLFGENANPYNPEQNVAAAHDLYLDQGFSPWSCARKLGIV